MKKLIVLVGPTAVGKTAAAIRLAQQLGTEIISADSRQIYREISIGTAKPSAAELQAVPHHFISNKSIHEDYDAGQYGRDALTLMDQLFTRYDHLVMVGGSGLYIKAVTEGFDNLPDVPATLRQEIIEQYQARGLPWLQDEVRQTDPVFFAMVDQKNPQRLMRALELWRHSGQPMHVLWKKEKRPLPFQVVQLGLNLDREILYERIDTRMDQMIEAGLFDEARACYPHRHRNALQTVGYREIFDHLDGLTDYAETVRLLKRNSRRYAKRQLTWFLRDPAIAWFAQPDALIQAVTKQ